MIRVHFVSNPGRKTVYPIPGHLAMSLAGTRIARLPYTPAIVATFAVDVIDKVFADVLRIAPYGRWWFHTLLSVAICSYLIGKWKGKEWGFSWMLGHFLHLIADIGFIPWFYPFIPYRYPSAPNMVAISVQGVQETIQGMHYSPSVLSVFIGKLMVAELFLLLAAVAMLPQGTFKKKPLAVTLSILFLVLFSFRMMYDFPTVLNTMSTLLGNWVFLR